MWQAPYDDGGTPILDYKVYWDGGLGSSMSLIDDSTGGPVTSWTTNGIIAGLDL